MKVLIVSNQFPPYFRGGDATVPYNEAKLLVEKGHEVSVIFDPVSFNGTKLSPFTKNGISFFPLNSSFATIQYGLSYVFNFNPFNYLKVKSIMKKINPDIVHCHNISSMGISPILAAKSLGIPIVYTAHDTRLLSPIPSESLDINTGFFGTLFKQLSIGKPPSFWLPFNIKDISVVTPSNYLAGLFRKRGFSPVVLHNSVIFKSSNSVEQKLVKDLGLKAKVVLLYVGILTERKGANRVVEALKSVDSDFKLLVVGEGPLKSELNALAKSPELKGKVSVLGHVSESVLSACYGVADVFVLPSTWENCPMTILEAMAAGTSVISSKVGGIPELVSDNGLLVSANDVKGLSLALEKLVKSPSLRSQFGKRSKAIFDSDFSYEKHVERLVKIYKKTIKNS